MIVENRPQYHKNMLPSIDYKEIEDSNSIIDLECDVMRHLSNFVDDLIEILKKEKIAQTTEFMLAHLCSYLGFLTSVNINSKKSSNLIPHIKKLIESESEKSYEIFSKFLMNHKDKTKEEKEIQFLELRHNTPSSIVSQTLRLGRNIFDSINMLNYYSLNYDKDKFFCPPNFFLELINKHSKVLKREWQDRLSMLFIINHISLQIGWIIGYYGYCDKRYPKTYLEYGLPCIDLFFENGFRS